MRSGNRGQVIIIFVLCLLVLLGFAALAIDVGYLFNVKGEFQRCADAGALAGAYAFHDGGWVSGSIPPSLQMKAEVRARDFATRDPVGAAPLGAGAITFAYPAVNQIQVTAQDSVNLFFAGIFGIPSITLTATAVALAEPVDQNVECMTPLAFPYPYTDSPPYNMWNGETLEPFPVQGRLVTFQVADTPDSGIPAYVQSWAGEIFPIRMCGDAFNGESDLRRRIRTPCWDDCNAISIGDTVRLKGNTTFYPTINEINNSIISGDPTASWDASSTLPRSMDPRYSGDNWLFSPRVMRVMLYNPQEAKTNGGFIIVRRFAGFWVLQANNSASNRFIRGYLVPDSAVGGSSSSPILIEPSLKTTRLVQ